MKVRSYSKNILFSLFISMQGFACEYLDDQNKYRRGKFNLDPNKEELFVKQTENTNKFLSAYDKTSNALATLPQKIMIIKTTMIKFLVHKDSEKYKMSFKELQKTDKKYKHFRMLGLIEAFTQRVVNANRNKIKDIGKKAFLDFWDEYKELEESGKLPLELIYTCFDKARDEHFDGLFKLQARGVLDSLKAKLNDFKVVDRNAPRALEKNELKRNKDTADVNDLQFLVPQQAERIEESRLTIPEAEISIISSSVLSSIMPDHLTEGGCTEAESILLTARMPQSNICQNSPEIGVSLDVLEEFEIFSQTKGCVYEQEQYHNDDYEDQTDSERTSFASFDLQFGEYDDETLIIDWHSISPCSSALTVDHAKGKMKNDENESPLTDDNMKLVSAANVLYADSLSEVVLLSPQCTEQKECDEDWDDILSDVDAFSDDDWDDLGKDVDTGGMVH
ncbi:MAG: hypothetical protein V4482_02730 [Pseudomonadota bacterium]